METATKLREADAAQLMNRYQATRSIADRNQLVMYYSYIAKVIAAQMRGYTANYAQLEDMVNQGMMTLIDALEKFDPEKGVKFESYAFMRVKNANIDFIRKQDWLPRRVRKTAKDIAAAYDSLSNQLMREPTLRELAAHMELPEEQLSKHYGEMSNSVMISLETVLQGSLQEDSGQELTADSDRPEEQLFRDELHHKLMEALDALSERERTVVSLYYYEHLRLYEIADIMGVSESRVCQLHAKAISRMKLTMDSYMKG